MCYFIFLSLFIASSSLPTTTHTDRSFFFFSFFPLSPVTLPFYPLLCSLFFV